MSTRTRSQRRRRAHFTSVHVPHGVLHTRVTKVGPERFGIATVDVGKSKSEWMLCDFYGRVLVEPREVCHTRCGFEMAIVLLRDALEKHQIEDQVVAVERTGNYHLPVKRAFQAAGFETRIVHPYATAHFRQPADPGRKTDPNDLKAMFRATVSGFGLSERKLDEVSEHLQLLARHRRDLVWKRTALYCQIREHLDALLPGYGALFEELWDSSCAIHVARQFGSPKSILQARLPGLKRSLREARLPVYESVLQRIVTWAANAAAPAESAAVHQRIWFTLDDDRAEKTAKIQLLERDIAALLVRTPYVLLLSFPGINVVSAGELAGELGPISHYANAKTITGRAGLFPSRHQSAEVDLQNGQMVRCCNRRLRAALLMIADNLITCNLHFRALNATWKREGKDARDSRVKVASRFTRILYQLVAGRQVYRHPSQRERSCILDKLIDFHHQHGTPPDKILEDLHRARLQLPTHAYAQEAAPLQARYERARNRRRREPQPIADILLAVLARLGVGAVESTSEARDAQ